MPSCGMSLGLGVVADVGGVPGVDVGTAVAAAVGGCPGGTGGPAIGGQPGNITGAARVVITYMINNNFENKKTKKEGHYGKQTNTYASLLDGLFYTLIKVNTSQHDRKY